MEWPAWLEVSSYLSFAGVVVVWMKQLSEALKASTEAQRAQMETLHQTLLVMERRLAAIETRLLPLEKVNGMNARIESLDQRTR